MRPWRQLDRILVRLPRYSLYRAALDDDDEFAAAVVSLHDDASPAPVPLAGYSELAARLDNVFDAVNALTETLVSIHTGKGTPVPTRAERPETAYQRLRRERSLHRLHDIERQMLGGR